MYWYLRLHFDARTDLKLARLTDAQHRIWFNLLCYAGECHDEGRIPPIGNDLLALECSNGNAEILEETIDLLLKLRILDLDPDDNSISFCNWIKRQYDKPSDAPSAAAERKRKQRERENQAKSVTVTPVSRDVTPRHAQIRLEQNRLEQNRVEENASASPPSPHPDVSHLKNSRIPSEELVKTWFTACGQADMWERFYLTFQSSGWKKANGQPIEDWTARAKLWISDQHNRSLDGSHKDTVQSKPPTKTPEQIAKSEEAERLRQIRISSIVAWSPPDTEGDGLNGNQNASTGAT